ncbi:MAG: nuclear transport factor 2 family protein [Planctomycetes bacterium]|nr:nuclear transport factor 2 family protein [Planctomycetota bacterium]
MASEAQAIRDTIKAWLKASKEGDNATLAEFLADDMKFIVAGQKAFGKREFFGGSGGKPYRFKSKVKVREVNVHGDWAQTWVELELAIVPEKGMQEMKLAGPTLSVWKKKGGQWQIRRDANMVLPK